MSYFCSALQSPQQSWVRACGRQLGSNTLDNQENAASAALSWPTVVQVRLSRTPQGICRHGSKLAASLTGTPHKRIATYKRTSLCVCYNRKSGSHTYSTPHRFLFYTCNVTFILLFINIWIDVLIFLSTCFFMLKFETESFRIKIERFVNLQKLHCNLFIYCVCLVVLALSVVFLYLH